MSDRIGRSPVQVKGLWEGYRARTRKGWRRGPLDWALRDVSFEVLSGELLGVVGSNGSGKSTLLKCLAGVLRPNKGSIDVAGRVASMIDLSAGFHRDLTGRENLLTAGVLSCLTRKEIKERYDAITSFSGLDPDEINSPLFTYSSGMMLRLGFALAINSSPSVLLLDEVMAVGDVNFRRKCVERISSELDSGCAGVLVSHDLKLVAERCERVVVLDNGRQMFTGPAGAALDFYLNLMGEGDPTADRLVAGE